jgi:hypothetical protein
MDLKMMERVGDRQEKMEGYCSTGPQRSVVPMEEEEEDGGKSALRNVGTNNVLLRVVIR